MKRDASTSSSSRSDEPAKRTKLAGAGVTENNIVVPSNAQWRIEWPLRDESPPLCSESLLRSIRMSSAASAALQRIFALSSDTSTRPPRAYLDRPDGSSSDFTALMLMPRQRERVVKYINELAEDFELCVQTGSLAVNYFDRYLSALYAGPVSDYTPTDRRQIQMVASTCLHIAAKFFDRKLPPLSELSKVHHGTVAASKFAELEHRILISLKWQLYAPLPHAFAAHLVELCAGAPFTDAIEERMLFFIDLSVYGYQFLQYSPASVASASLLTAWTFSDEYRRVNTYIGVLARACEVNENVLRECVNMLVRYYQTCFPEAAKQCEKTTLFVPMGPPPPCVPATGSTDTVAVATSSAASSPQERRMTAESIMADRTNLDDANAEPPTTATKQPKNAARWKPEHAIAG